jgi:hypothetical protein
MRVTMQVMIMLGTTTTITGRAKRKSRSQKKMTMMTRRLMIPGWRARTLSL